MLGNLISQYIALIYQIYTLAIVSAHQDCTTGPETGMNQLSMQNKQCNVQNENPFIVSGKSIFEKFVILVY